MAPIPQRSRSTLDRETLEEFTTNALNSNGLMRYLRERGHILEVAQQAAPQTMFETNTDVSQPYSREFMKLYEIIIRLELRIKVLEDERKPGQRFLQKQKPQ
jgi:hypothetical protein